MALQEIKLTESEQERSNLARQVLELADRVKASTSTFFVSFKM